MMLSPSPAQILELWERGVGQHPLERALLLLRGAQACELPQDSADVPIAERDQMLIGLRRAMFGDRLPGYVDCPECKVRLEFVLDADTLYSEASSEAIEVDELRIRRPTSRDLARVMNEPDPEKAAYQLAQQCFVVAPDASASEAPILDTARVRKIEFALAEADAAADMILDFSCSECGFVWQTLFDIGDYLWREIDMYAGKLMSDIHTLARAYGWSEHEILGLSDTRRAAYIDMVLA